MFYCEEETKPRAASRSRLIRALDTTVAFATLETYGVIDARELLSVNGPAGRPESTRGGSPHKRTAVDCAPARRSHGRPAAATSAGRRRHRAARTRIERLGQ